MAESVTAWPTETTQVREQRDTLTAAGSVLDGRLTGQRSNGGITGTTDKYDVPFHLAAVGDHSAQSVHSCAQNWKLSNNIKY